MTALAAAGVATGLSASALPDGPARHVRQAGLTTIHAAALAPQAGNDAGSEANATDIIMTRMLLRGRAEHALQHRHASRPARTARRTGGPHTVTCSADASGMVPENYPAIVGFLVSHGYTGSAAAGIAGNIYQESKGNPESVGSGGGGLIGWTPLPPGLVTGNPVADLRTQLQAILVYNQQWSAYLPALNSASSPAGAAAIYVTYFERAGIPAAANRETAAADVAAACGL